MKINKKGFTLTELLVVIVILGIITGISVPLIRGLSTTFEKKKYQNYADSVLSSAKLYNDSYNEDLFGHNEYGCAYITYDELVERGLLKDIEIDGVSCNSDKTYIRVTKQKDKYGYANYLACGDKKDGKAENIKTSIPEVIPDMNTDSCTGTNDNNLVITATPNKSVGFNKKKKTTKLKISSGTGINNTIVIYTLWSKTTSEADKVTDWKKTTFKVIGNQEAILLNGNEVTTTSSEIVTPDMSGSLHLLVRVDNLQDLYGNKWKNTEHPGNNIIDFGPYDVDIDPPTTPTLKGYKKSSSDDVTSVSGLTEHPSNTWYSGWLVLLASGSTDNSGSVTYYYTVTGASTNTTDSASSTGTRNVDAQGESTIKVKACDEAGNCSSTVEYKAKLDRTKPTITANVYKANSSVNGKTGSSLAYKKVDNDTSTGTISSANVTGNTNGWFGTGYPGLWYEFSYSDNIELDSSEWAWNTANLANNASGYTTLNGSGSPTKTTLSGTSRSESHSISAEGHRYARFTVKDKAGNTSYINVEAKLDRTAPTYTSAEIKSITSTGYDVFVYGVADKYSGVNRVQFPTWTTASGQDDIQSNWSTNTAAKGTLQSDGTTWKYRVNTRDHNNEAGAYNTHVYMYDNVGNQDAKGLTAVTVPQVTATFSANGCGTPSPSSISKPANTALGTLPTISKTGYTFNGWFTAASGGSQISTSTKMPSSNVTYYAHCTINKYTVTVTPKVDGTTYTSGGVSNNGNFTFNVYVNDSLASSGANSYSASLNYGTKVRVVAINHRGYTITANSDVTATVGTSGLTFVPTWAHSTATITYKSAVMGSGAFQNSVTGPALSGTTGQSKTIDQFQVTGLSAANTTGEVYWIIHQQDRGDMPSASTYYYYPGNVQGEAGKRLEGIKMKLGGEFADYFDIYYRVHLQDIGWLNWTSNDDFTGSRGLCKRMEAVKVMVVPKGTNVTVNECGAGEACQDTSVIVNNEASNCPEDDGSGGNSTPMPSGSNSCTKTAYKSYSVSLHADQNFVANCRAYGQSHLHTKYGVKGTFVSASVISCHSIGNVCDCGWKEKYVYTGSC